MAEPQVTFRVPRALLALIDAEAARSQRTRSQLILDVLADKFMGEDAAPAPREPKAAKPKAKPAKVVPASQLRERDLAPRMAERDTRGDGRGGGIVAGLKIPIGNVRRPLAKGAGKAKG